MRIFKSKVKNYEYFVYRLIHPVLDPVKLARGIAKYPGYIRDLLKYTKLGGSESIELRNSYPVLNEDTKYTPFDSHYFYQDIWAANRIYSSKVRSHFDVGSNIKLVGFLTIFTDVTFIDIRPINAKLKNLRCIKGSILKLPFEDNSIKSLSCLHVAEHVGLGRYGDKLDPFGTKRSCKELARVLAKDGKLYFSLPVGKSRTCFNAHRIHSPRQILEYFKQLQLVELSGISDSGEYIKNIEPDLLENSDYACGLFVFSKM